MSHPRLIWSVPFRVGGKSFADHIAQLETSHLYTLAVFRELSEVADPSLEDTLEFSHYDGSYAQHAPETVMRVEADKQYMSAQENGGDQELATFVGK